MKKNYFVLAVAFMVVCTIFVACDKNPQGFAGTYDLHLDYDSVMTSDGTWIDETFFEEMTGKKNPSKDGYLTIRDGKNGNFEVTATIVNKETNEENVLFTTNATEKDGILILDNCTSDYYYDTTELYIDFTFHNFENNMPIIKFKGIYTIDLGADFSYLLSFTCTKR